LEIKTMFKYGKTALIVTITLSVLGTSAALAGGKDDDGWGQGGIKIGPLGQRFGGPPTGGAFAFAPPITRHVRVPGRHYRYHY
jgi:hypothetical protein